MYQTVFPGCKGEMAPFIRGLLSACVTLSLGGGERRLSESLASTCELGELDPTLSSSEAQCSYQKKGIVMDQLGELDGIRPGSSCKVSIPPEVTVTYRCSFLSVKCTRFGENSTCCIGLSWGFNDFRSVMHLAQCPAHSRGSISVNHYLDHSYFVVIILKLFICLSIFGCTGSSLLRVGFL